MKHLLFLSLVFVAVNYHNATFLNFARAYSIDKPDTSIHKTYNCETLAGEWQLQPVLASDTASGKIPTLKFNLLDNSFTGFSGCNAISGSFVTKGDALSFNKEIISTKMACPGYNEKIFMTNLLRTNRYEIKQGVLHLMYNATSISNWVRHADTTSTKRI